MDKIRLASVVAAIMALVSCSTDVEQWRVKELSFESETDYNVSGADEIMLDVTFTHPESGRSMTIPAFWDGGKTFRVRFAPTLVGKWTWRSSCQEDASLAGLTGKISCGRYKGDLDIYRHGFVTVIPGRKYFSYADGTPFFYLGDTHWGMYREEIDEPGPNAGETGTQSHFKYIVDRRSQQQFTVYQSEPIDSEFNMYDGHVDPEDIAGFQLADRYYQHIADRGLVHANADLFYASKMNPDLTDIQLERLSRYWVARFGAYPVMWTLAQEVDNDFYADRKEHEWYDHTNNPWLKVAEYMHKYDAYSNPLSAHQENTSHTTITGRGVSNDPRVTAGGVSIFASPDVAVRTGHNWWAAQWSPSLTKTSKPGVPADYLDSEYPAVNYEGRYCYLWTKDFGARAQGWISFLSGFCGYGYGAIDMWLYKSTYNTTVPSFDGVDTISVADKAVPWCDAVEFESAGQMAYLRNFMESFDWWNLSPILNGDERFIPAEGSFWSCATTADRIVAYFYGDTAASGTLAGQEPGRKFDLTWYNPRSSEAQPSVKVEVAADGTLALPERPDSADWVVCLFCRR